MIDDSDIKEIFTVGTEFTTYYGNGEPIDTYVVIRVNEKSCWYKSLDDTDPNSTGNRSSWNTIARKYYAQQSIKL